jgi:hypothetical protein
MVVRMKAIVTELRSPPLSQGIRRRLPERAGGLQLSIKLRVASSFSWYPPDSRS